MESTDHKQSYISSRHTLRYWLFNDFELIPEVS